MTGLSEVKLILRNGDCMTDYNELDDAEKLKTILEFADNLLSFFDTNKTPLDFAANALSAALAGLLAAADDPMDTAETYTREIMRQVQLELERRAVSEQQQATRTSTARHIYNKGVDLRG
jgi:hypothetical protein